MASPYRWRCCGLGAHRTKKLGLTPGGIKNTERFHTMSKTCDDRQILVNEMSNHMPHLQPFQSQSPYRRSAALLKRRPTMPHHCPPPTTRQYQESMHHLMHNSSPDILLGIPFEHRFIQSNVDLRNPANSAWQTDTTKRSAGCGGHIYPTDEDSISETAIEEYGVQVCNHRCEELRTEILLRYRERHAKSEKSRGLLAVYGLTEACNEILLSLLR